MGTPIPRNRASFTVAELVAATGGWAVELPAATVVTGIATDSRTLTAGTLFVALRGESYDGHDFVDAARARGAVSLVASQARTSGPRIEVDDPLVALGRIARAHVERLAAVDGPRPTLAIGGAAGKTTTKTLAAAAVEALFGDTLVTAGNLNNRIGVPMTLLTLEPRHRAVVLECATSEPGEIAALGEIVQPDAALVVNVGVEHSERLGDLEAIADEEATLFRFARSVAVTSSEEPLLRRRQQRVNAARKLLFGFAEEADVRLSERRPRSDGGGAVRLRIAAGLAAGGDREIGLTTRLVGPAAALNLAAALAGALALLARPATAAELAAVAAALGDVEPVAGRLRPIRLDSILLLDDSYNSNPRSLAAALAAASEVAAQRDRTALVLALGDMLELGELEAAAHETAVRDALALAPRRLLLVGPRMAAGAAAADAGPEVPLFADSTAAAAALPGLLAPGDTLLVKGSRGTRMERLVEALAPGVPAAG